MPQTEDMKTQTEPAQPSSHETLIGGILDALNHAKAIAEGLQVDVTNTARKAGILFPVFLTRAVFNACVAVPAGVLGQDEASRLWEVVRMTRLAILRSHGHTGRMTVALYVRNDNHTVRLVKLIAVCSALALNDPQQAITVMTVDED